MVKAADTKKARKEYQQGKHIGKKYTDYTTVIDDQESSYDEVVAHRVMIHLDIAIQTTNAMKAAANL